MEQTQTKTLTLHIQPKTFLLLLGIGILFFTFFLRSPSYIWIDLWFMLEIFVLTFFTRTISLRYGLGIFSQGVFISGLLTLIFYQFLSLLHIQDTAGGEVFAVIFEEVIKFAPVALASFWFWKREKLFFNGSDFLFLSAMCAAGFSLFEKSFWQGVVFPFTYGPHIRDLYFFSDALGIYVQGEPFGYIGHAAATGLIGMGVGLGFFYRAKKKALWWLLPAFAFGWVTLEHLLSNLYYVTGTEALLSFGGGMLTPWIFLLFLVFVLYKDVKNLRYFFLRYPEAREDLKQKRKDFFGVVKTQPSSTWKKAKILIRQLRALHSLAWEESLKK